MREEDISDLYKCYYSDVYRFIYMLTLNSFDAEDILQNVFLRVMRSFHHFRGDSSVKTWLFAIARNEYLNYIKKNRRDTEDISNIVITIGSQVDEILLKKEDAKIIINFIHVQEEPIKSLLILRLLEEKSFVEIGSIINRSEIWCRVTFFRIKKKMMDLLDS